MSPAQLLVSWPKTVCAREICQRDSILRGVISCPEFFRHLIQL